MYKLFSIMLKENQNEKSPVQTINEQEATNARILEFFKTLPPDEFAQQLNRACHIMTSLAFEDVDNLGQFSDWIGGCFYYITDFSEVLSPKLTKK